jgi:thiamine monophosphate kinase
MIDLSDGLASDVRHLATESAVGVILDANRIPVHADVDPTLPDTA